MNKDYLKRFIDLSRTDIEPEFFAAAPAILHIRKLLTCGGSSVGLSDLESVLPPPVDQGISRLSHLNCADKLNALKTNGVVYNKLSLYKICCEKGQAHFQGKLTRAMKHPKEMEYLSQFDFAE